MANTGAPRPEDRLVAVTMVSMCSARSIRRKDRRGAHAAECPSLDAARPAPRCPSSEGARADFLAFSGKMYGPFGIGIPTARAHARRPASLHGGGDMISKCGSKVFRWNELPYKFEAGTPPISQAVGPEAQQLALQRRAGCSGRIRIGSGPALHGRHKGHSGHPVLARRTAGRHRVLPLEGAHRTTCAAYLVRFHIAVRAGHHCAHPLARRYGFVSWRGRASAPTTPAKTWTPQPRALPGRGGAMTIVAPVYEE